MVNPNLKTALIDWNGCDWVESVPERLHGTPVLARSRMPADAVVENFDGGMSVDELSGEYGLDRSAVEGVLKFAGRISQAHAA